eukprot:CAMPEP_0201549246 /NCGR_PEP_ID=MMETSP0173_2-20130828/5733_1 /ASSEMBLY_ACC=CAM_ASM_000268 /TAXON_ID=218659 /ORGANISM="Vexillifera sp., Strain DIVA3 564/2" /LENGTH=511 /DNA_ID=CAMNT_0047958859 /DNA_START=1064 /DNA_END=2596 /DNA_ORIENTATION=-
MSEKRSASGQPLALYFTKFNVRSGHLHSWVHVPFEKPVHPDTELMDVSQSALQFSVDDNGDSISALACSFHRHVDSPAHHLHRAQVKLFPLLQFDEAFADANTTDVHYNNEFCSIVNDRFPARGFDFAKSTSQQDDDDDTIYALMPGKVSAQVSSLLNSKDVDQRCTYYIYQLSIQPNITEFAAHEFVPMRPISDHLSRPLMTFQEKKHQDTLHYVVYQLAKQSHRTKEEDDHRLPLFQIVHNELLVVSSKFVLTSKWRHVPLMCDSEHALCDDQSSIYSFLTLSSIGKGRVAGLCTVYKRDQLISHALSKQLSLSNGLYLCVTDIYTGLLVDHLLITADTTSVKLPLTGHYDESQHCYITSIQSSVDHPFDQTVYVIDTNVNVRLRYSTTVNLQLDNTNQSSSLHHVVAIQTIPSHSGDQSFPFWPLFLLGLFLIFPMLISAAASYYYIRQHGSEQQTMLLNDEEPDMFDRDFIDQHSSSDQDGVLIENQTLVVHSDDDDDSLIIHSDND